MFIGAVAFAGCGDEHGTDMWLQGLMRGLFLAPSSSTIELVVLNSVVIVVSAEAHKRVNFGELYFSCRSEVSIQDFGHCGMLWRWWNELFRAKVTQHRLCSADRFPG